MDEREEEEFKQTVSEVLAGDETLLEAGRRLHALGSAAIDKIATGVHAPNGPDLRVLTASIAVRSQNAFGTVLFLVEAGRANHARLALRPMVEDHIFLRWLQTLGDDLANDFITTRTEIEILEAYRAQRGFLPQAYDRFGVDGADGRAAGLQVRLREEALDEAYARIKALGQGRGWGKRGPTIRKMAEVADLEEEYDFFYAATSRVVHANVHEMARMVWGDANSHIMNVGDTLDPYHQYFALAYGAWMYDAVLASVRDAHRGLGEVMDDLPWSVWLALIIAGLARNYALPPIVTEELRWPSDQDGGTMPPPSGA